MLMVGVEFAGARFFSAKSVNVSVMYLSHTVSLRYTCTAPEKLQCTIIMTFTSANVNTGRLSLANIGV